MILGGKVRSPATGETYEIKDGYLDLLKSRTGADNLANLTNFLPGAGRGYEPLWRVRSLSLLTGESFPNERELEIIKRLVHPVRSGRYLDLGCSAGLYSRSLSANLDSGIAVGIDISPSMLREAVRRAHAVGRSRPSSGRKRRTFLSQTPLSRAPSAAAPSTSSGIPHESCGRPTGSSNPEDVSPSWASCASPRRAAAGSSACSPRAASGSSTPTSYTACSTTRGSSQTRPRRTVPSSSRGLPDGVDATVALKGLYHFGGR